MAFKSLNNIQFCVCVLQITFFLYPFLYDRHLAYFHILAMVNNAVIKVVVQISLQEIDFISFRCIQPSPSCSPCIPAQSSRTISLTLYISLIHYHILSQNLPFYMINTLFSVVESLRIWAQSVMETMRREDVFRP